MSLTKSHWVSVGVGFGAVLLTAVIHIGIREWYQPDVRYEEGRWYRSNKVAVASLRLHNVGHSDAEELRVTASFGEELSDIATSDPGIPFKTLAGGVGARMVTGTVARLVPGETVYVYFATSPLPVVGHQVDESFISSVVFRGGTGKTGEESVFLGIAAGGLLVTCAWAIMNLMWRFDRRGEPGIPKDTRGRRA